MRGILSEREGELVFLHGHLHDRGYRRWATTSGATVHHLGATSASLLHEHPDRAAGYNVYEIEAGRVAKVYARVYDDRTQGFATTDVSNKSSEFAD